MTAAFDPAAAVETARLRLVPIAQDHAAAAYALFNRPEILAWMMRVRVPVAPADTEAFIADSVAARAAGTAYRYAIERRADGVLVGGCSLDSRGDGTAGELGYWIVLPYQRLG